MEAANRVFNELKASGVRLKLDEREEVTPGFKYNDWELRGVPLRVEIGPKDVEKNAVALARRDISGRDGKSFVPQLNLASTVNKLLSEIQSSMLTRATAYRDANIHDPKTYDELKEVVQNGWAFSWWCGSKDCEAKVKEDTKASTRIIPLDQPGGTGKCIVCSEKADKKVYFARAY
jgi:prolyl-tRNA synthetase